MQTQKDWEGAACMGMDGIYPFHPALVYVKPEIHNTLY